MNRKIMPALIIVSLLTALLLIIILRTDISSPEEYYSSGTSGQSSDGDVSVTLMIDCSVILDDMDQVPSELRGSGLLPEDGIFLPETEFTVAEGSSVFDLLLIATKRYRIQMEYTGRPDGGLSPIYIKSIGHLYEFSCGPLSGWMFSVNDVFSGSDSSGYILKPGDKVKWAFTLDLGKDIGNDFNGGSQ